MADLLKLEVISPGAVLLRVDGVKKVIAQATDGQLGIFPGHTLMLAETVDGPLTYETAEGKETVSLSGGILKVSGSSVVIFSGGFFGDEEEDMLLIGEKEAPAEQEFSRLTREISRRLKLD